MNIHLLFNVFMFKIYFKDFSYNTYLQEIKQWLWQKRCNWFSNMTILIDWAVLQTSWSWQGQFYQYIVFNFNVWATRKERGGYRGDYESVSSPYIIFPWGYVSVWKGVENIIRFVNEIPCHKSGHLKISSNIRITRSASKRNHLV